MLLSRKRRNHCLSLQINCHETQCANDNETDSCIRRNDNKILVTVAYVPRCIYLRIQMAKHRDVDGNLRLRVKYWWSGVAQDKARTGFVFLCYLVVYTFFNEKNTSQCRLSNHSNSSISPLLCNALDMS